MAPQLAQSQRSQLHDRIRLASLSEKDIANVVNCSTRTVRSARANYRIFGSVSAPKYVRGMCFASAAKSWLRSSHHRNAASQLRKAVSAPALSRRHSLLTRLVLHGQFLNIADHRAIQVDPQSPPRSNYGSCRHRSRYRVTWNPSMPRPTVLLRCLEELRLRHQQHLQRNLRPEQDAHPSQDHATATDGRRKSWASENMREGL
jgi:hypothetical protein